MSLVGIDAWLPQTQCQSCEYDDCRDYAEAIANGSAAINRCPPGGETTIRGLAELLKRPVEALEPTLKPFNGYRIARVIEHECIGCTKCIQACPVDAIIGSGKRMHSVLESLCTGCELCIPPCPVDCIDLVPCDAQDFDNRWPQFPVHLVEDARRARQRHKRRSNTKQPRSSRPNQDKSELQDEILAAVARSHQRRTATTGSGRPVIKIPD